MTPGVVHICPHIRTSDEGTSYCDLAESMDETRAAWAQANRLEFTVDRLEGERDAALSEIARLREALDDAVRLLRQAEPTTRRYETLNRNVSGFLAALAEGSDVPPTESLPQEHHFHTGEVSEESMAHDWWCEECSVTAGELVWPCAAEGSDVPPTQRCPACEGSGWWAPEGCRSVPDSYDRCPTCEGMGVLPTQRDH